MVRREQIAAAREGGGKVIVTSGDFIRSVKAAVVDIRASPHLSLTYDTAVEQSNADKEGKRLAALENVARAPTPAPASATISPAAALVQPMLCDANACPTPFSALALRSSPPTDFSGGTGV